jgi:hypothetical protein
VGVKIGRTFRAGGFNGSDRGAHGHRLVRSSDNEAERPDRPSLTLRDDNVPLFEPRETRGLHGVVADPTGATVPGATLTLTDQDTTLVTATLKSDATGSLRAPKVPGPPNCPVRPRGHLRASRHTRRGSRQMAFRFRAALARIAGSSSARPAVCNPRN